MRDLSETLFFCHVTGNVSRPKGLKATTTEGSSTVTGSIFSRHASMLQVQGITTAIAVKTLLFKVVSVGTGAQYTSSRSNKLPRSQCIICPNYFQTEKLKK